MAGAADLLPELGANIRNGNSHAADACEDERRILGRERLFVHLEAGDVSAESRDRAQQQKSTKNTAALIQNGGSSLD
jgi:hypothetical protein